MKSEGEDAIFCIQMKMVSDPDPDGGGQISYMEKLDTRAGFDL